MVDAFRNDCALRPGISITVRSAGVRKATVKSARVPLPSTLDALRKFLTDSKRASSRFFVRLFLLPTIAIAALDTIRPRSVSGLLYFFAFFSVRCVSLEYRLMRTLRVPKPPFPLGCGNDSKVIRASQGRYRLGDARSVQCLAWCELFPYLSRRNLCTIFAPLRTKFWGNRSQAREQVTLAVSSTRGLARFSKALAKALVHFLRTGALEFTNISSRTFARHGLARQRCAPR